MKLLSIQKIADTMKVSQEKTIRRLIKRGAIAAYRVGERDQLRVKAGEIERYLEAQRVEIEKMAAPTPESEE